TNVRARLKSPKPQRHYAAGPGLARDSLGQHADRFSDRSEAEVHGFHAHGGPNPYCGRPAAYSEPLRYLALGVRKEWEWQAQLVADFCDQFCRLACPDG